MFVVQSLWFEPNPLTLASGARITPRADLLALLLKVQRLSGRVDVAVVRRLASW